MIMTRVRDYNLDFLLSKNIIIQIRGKSLPHNVVQRPVWYCVAVVKNLQQAHLILKRADNGEKISVGEGTEILWVSNSSTNNIERRKR